MDRRLLVAGALLVVVAVAALAVAAGLVPFGGNSGGDVDFPTETGTPVGTAIGGGGGDANGSADDSTPVPPFRMTVDSVESCGQTCRDVTATLYNQQERRATGVTVFIRIYPGNDTEGDPVWEGSQEIGELGPGESKTDTKRVELGMMEAATVQSHDGRVTILLVVETDRRTVRFVEHRDVS